MKNKLLTALVAVAVLSPLAVQAQTQSQAQNFYIGLGAGRSHLDNARPTDNNDTSYKIFAGYDFSKMFGVELGYNNLYDRDSTTGTRYAEEKAHSVHLALTGTLPLSEQFDLYGKLGAARNRDSGSVRVAGVTTQAFSNTDTDLYAAVGARFNLNTNMDLGLEWERFNSDLDAVTLNLRYKF